MGYDEELYQLKNKRYQLDEDYDQSCRTIRRKEEELEDWEWAVSDILQQNERRIEHALQFMEVDSSFLRTVYDEYQENRWQVGQFIAAEYEKITEERSWKKKDYEQALDDNEKQIRRLGERYADNQ